MRPRASPTGSWVEHLLDGALAAEEHAAQADRHDRVPVVLAGLEQALGVGAGDDRVGDHHVQAPRPLHGGAHEQVDVIGARGVGLDERPATALLEDQIAVGRPPSRGSARTSPTTTSAPSAGEAQRHRAPEARGAARHDDRLSRQARHGADRRRTRPSSKTRRAEARFLGSPDAVIAPISRACGRSFSVSSSVSPS